MRVAIGIFLLAVTGHLNAEPLRSEFYSTESFYSSFYGSSSGDSPFVRYADSGLPLINRDGQYVIHPVGIAQRLLRYHGNGFSPDDGKNKREFKGIIQDIITSANLNTITGKLAYSFPFTAGKYQHHFETGWGSAMAQGVMLSVLARAYLDYPNLRRQIKNYANRLMSPLTQDVSAGGLSYRLAIGDGYYTFYSEYPADSHPPLTLNGFMFTLIGLHEYAVVSESAEAERLFEEGAETLARILPFYNTYPVSTYDLSYITFDGVKPNISPRYHAIHVKQLDYLHHITGEPLFACTRDSMAKKSRRARERLGEDYRIAILGEDIRWNDACAHFFEVPTRVYRSRDIGWVKQ